jgi:hypothetical protein
MCLASVDHRRRYHDLADWGVDVLHVGPSMGIGGLGLYRANRLERLSAAGGLSVEVLEGRGANIAFRLVHNAVAVTDAINARVTSMYSMRHDSPLTFVEATSDSPALSFGTGLAAPVRGEFLQSAAPVDGWSWIAVWGPISETGDHLGLALIYPAAEATRQAPDRETYPIRFGAPRARYAFFAAWEGGVRPVRDREAFLTMIEQQRRITVAHFSGGQAGADASASR